MLSDTLDAVLHDADALLIVPPFADYDRPALGVHILQACARAEGFDVCVLYANLLLARGIGEVDYRAICYAPTSDLLGERFFAYAAYGVDAHVFQPGLLPSNRMNTGPHTNPAITLYWDEEKFHHFAMLAMDWVEALTDMIEQYSFRTVGCTTLYEQTAASVAILNHIKRKSPEIVTILGGSNCTGRMAEGIRSLDADIDYVFSGECEGAFPQFLHALAEGTRPDHPIVVGTPCIDMDRIPTPDFLDYYDQHTRFFSESSIAKAGDIWLPYETSRGYWAREKRLVGEKASMQFREKSPDRIVTELHTLFERHPNNKVCMSDIVMPQNHFQTLLSELAEALPHLHMAYTQTPPLSLARMRLLKQAGVSVMQADIDALSTTFLMAMKKGVTAAQNIAFLRYACATDIRVYWHLLQGFPGDRLEWYEKMITLLPMLMHLHPPVGVSHLSLDRYSPYFLRAPAYGIQNMRPIDAYFEVLPVHANVNAIACYFIGDYPGESRTHPTIISELERRVTRWRKRWMSGAGDPPALAITPLQDGQYLLTDTRGLAGYKESEHINRHQAAMALAGEVSDSMGYADWGIERGVCVRVDGRLVPLATADADVLEEFETAARQNRNKIVDSRQEAVGSRQ